MQPACGREPLDVPPGIPNFAWVEAGRVARGQQPALTIAAYRELQACGVTSVLSLRPTIEYPENERLRYAVEEERDLCAALGLRFLHVPCTDFQAPRPGSVIRALRLLDAEVEQGNAVYVHCLAGVGRTGVVCGAWQLLRSASGTETLRQFARFAHEAHGRRGPQRPLEEFLQRIGAHEQAWVLLSIARALGAPVALPAAGIAPRRPARAASHWRQRFREQAERHLPHYFAQGQNGAAPPLDLARRRSHAALEATPLR
jgi:protein-tyrosine phosphatase